MNILEYWQGWLAENPLPIQVGELQLWEGYWICHKKDVLTDPLVPIPSLLDLKLKLRMDSKGLFRPLKGKPGMVRGWKFGPLDAESLFYALEGIYPLALTHWIGYKEKILLPVDFKSTIQRQVGMYQILGKGDETLIDRATREICLGQCLRQNLWWSNQPLIGSKPSSIPLVCLEACPFFLEQARKLLLKKRQPRCSA